MRQMEGNPQTIKAKRQRFTTRSIAFQMIPTCAPDGIWRAHAVHLYVDGSYLPDTDEYKPVVEKMAAVGLDAIVETGMPDEMANLLDVAMRELNFQGRFSHCFFYLWNL